MKNSLKTTWEEAKKQFLARASYALNLFPKTPMQSINAQIDKALTEDPKRIIFVLAPRGAGKTTQVQSFRREHPEFRYLYRSYIKIDSFDFAFLHLTETKLRLFFLFTGILISYFLFPRLPGPAISPILLLTSLSLLKTFGHAIYILHETVDNLIKPRNKVVILEDLDRSLIDENQRWEFLANLWQNKRSYIVTLGYPPQDPKKKLELIENAIKLGGRIVEIPLNEQGNYELIKKLDPDFPFNLQENEHGWLSLFTFREMHLLFEQTQLKIASSKENKQIIYVELALNLLLAKINLTNQEFILDKITKEIHPPSPDKISPDQSHFIHSFCESLDPKAGITIAPAEVPELV